jgi:preprotein translocase subunit SecG
LNRITIAMSLLWVISVVLLGYIQKFWFNFGYGLKFR